MATIGHQSHFSVIVIEIVIIVWVRFLAFDCCFMRAGFISLIKRLFF